MWRARLEDLVPLAADPDLPQGGEDLGVARGGLGIGPDLDGPFEALGSGNLPQTDQRPGIRRFATQGSPGPPVCEFWWTRR